MIVRTGIWLLSSLDRRRHPTSQCASQPDTLASTSDGTAWGKVTDTVLSGPRQPGTATWATSNIGHELKRDGAFHHVVMVNDAVADVFKIYVDGNLQVTSGSVGLTSKVDGVFLLGRQPGNSNMAIGLLDEVAFFNKAISSDDVAWLRSNSVAAIPEPATLCLLALGGLSMAKCRR